MRTVLLSLMVLLGANAQGKSAEKSDLAAEYGALKYRQIGPAVGGRITRVTGVANDVNTYYFAAAQGGVWKTSNAGHSWAPIFDDQDTQSIGSIAIAPSDSNVLYVGSGEANIRGNVALGYGIWKSTDAGASFTQVLKLKGQVGTMAVDPKNPDIALAAVLGSPFGPGSERGIYRTQDGGQTWAKTLYKDVDTGASDVAINLQNPRIVYAGLWQARRQPWGMTSGGPGSGLYRSSDGGISFEEITGGGLPEKPYGKIGLAVAPSDGSRVYALIEAKNGGLFRSDDGGESFARINGHPVLRQRAWYYSTIVVDPHQKDIVWFPQVRLLRSTDGGKTIESIGGQSHGDHHDLWINPNHPKLMINGHDGGVDLTIDGGTSWMHPDLPLAQFYNIDVDARMPYHVGGTMQDMGTASGPSAVFRSDGPNLADWLYVGGGEAGDFVFDPHQPGQIYAGEYGGYLSHYDQASGQIRNISPYPANPSGKPASSMVYRFQWTAPILASTITPNVVYHGGNVLFKSTDQGQSFTPISPDLTRNDKSKQAWSGGPITGDITTVEYYDTIFSLAESPLDANTLWAGTDDGLLHITNDGGKTWSNVTPKGLPTWATIESIEACKTRVAEAFVVAHNYRLDDHAPYLFHTTDAGRSWNKLTGGLPDDLTLWAVRRDPDDENFIYLGTQRGVWYSSDSGKHFQPLKLNLPNVAVTDIETRHGDLIVGTRGRAIWALENRAILRGLASARASDFKLLPAANGMRVQADFAWVGEGAGAQENRDFGVVGYYWIKTEATDAVKSKLPIIKLEIIDSAGKIIRTLTDIPKPNQYRPEDPDEPEKPNEPELSVEKGLQRFVWDLTTDGAKPLLKSKLDSGDAETGPVAIPGSYTLRMSYQGKTSEQTIKVLADPRSKVSADDQLANYEFARDMIGSIDRARAMIEGVRDLRRQLDAERKNLLTRTDTTDAFATAMQLMSEINTIDGSLHNPKARVVYDVLAGRDGGAKLYNQLVPLYGAIVSSEHRPTQSMIDHRARLSAELQQIEARYKAMLNTQLVQYNAAVRALGGGLIAPAE